MITGILTAFPNDSLFDEAMTELQSTAKFPVKYEGDQDRLRLPQVHALNCLKDVFTNTFLGPPSEQYLERTLNLSVDCLSHDM